MSTTVSKRSSATEKTFVEERDPDRGLNPISNVLPFIRKPVGFAGFVDFMKVFCLHNLDLVRIPKKVR